MNIEDEIKNILFKIGQEIVIHEIDKDNSVIEINYDKYTVELMKLFKDYLTQ